MPVNNPFALVSGLQYVDGTASTATSFTGTVAMSFNGTALVGLRSDATDNLLVTGTLTHNNAVPAANNFGVLPAVASSAPPTYNGGDQVLLSTDLAGNLRVNATFTGTATNNITQWNSVNVGSPSAYGTSPGAVNVIGVNAFVTNTVAQNQTQLNSVALGSPSNYGTSPGAVSVQGVNAFVTNTVAVTLTSTTITGTVAVTQSTSPWTVQGDSASGAANAGNPVKIGGVFNTTQPTVTNGQTVDAQTTARGAQIVATGVDTFNVTVNTALPAGTNVIGHVITDSGSTTVVTGTVAVTQSTSPWVVSLASTTITGTVAVTQSTSPWVVAGALTNNNAAPAATQIGVLPAIAETAYTTVTYTTGDQVLPVTDLHGALNQDLQAYAGTQLTGTVTAYGTAPTGNVFGVNAFVTNTVAVTMTSTTITGTVAVTQSTTPWVVNATQWASTALGTPQTFGTAPTGVVIGTSSDIYIAGTRARSNQTTTAAGVMDVNIVGSLGATNSVTNGTFIAITDNTTKAGVIAATTALKTDWSSQAGTAITTTPVAFGTGTPAGNAPGVNAAQYVGTTPVRSNQTTTATGVVDHNLVGIKGTTVVTVAAGVQEVGIVGSTGATLDSTVGSATAPTNAIATSAVYNTTQPAPTNGQATALQQDESANLLTYPGVSVNTGAAWNNATTINTLQFPTGTATVGQPLGGQSVLVQLNQTTTLTAGAVTFQGSYDNGANWVTIPVAQVVDPQTYQPQTNPYTFQASTNKPFLILLQGFTNIRLNLTTLITGTGSVTPRWNVLQGSPVQVITSVVSTAGGTSVATGSIGATKTAIKTSGGNVFGWYFYNSNSSVAYVQMFNLASASVTLGTTAPTQSMGIPPGSAANMAFDVGVSYGTAITIAITTTRAGLTGPTNTVDYNIFYV